MTDTRMRWLPGALAVVVYSLLYLSPPILLAPMLYLDRYGPLSVLVRLSSLLRLWTGSGGRHPLVDGDQQQIEQKEKTEKKEKKSFRGALDVTS
jgi:hypothetical protein